MPLPQLKEYEQYRGARLLIWLHSLPIGEVDLSFTSEPLSTDRLASMLWPLMADAVVAHNRGLALAHNVALSALTGKIVAITDDDVEVHPDWLTAIAEAFAESDATCVTGLILPAELQTPAQLLVERAGGYGRGFATRIYAREMPDCEPLFPFAAGRFGSGANMAFRTDWLVDHGGFDRAMGAGTPARGGDDLVAFPGVIVDGGTLVYEPRAVVRHWHRREYEGIRRRAFGYGIGLGAYFAATLWARPRLLGAMLRRAIPAACYLLSPASAKNIGRRVSFPRELVWRARAGVMAGPFAYSVSRWRYRNRTERPAVVLQ